MSKRYWNAAKRAQERRSRFDKIVVRLFRKTINRLICAHLSVANEYGHINRVEEYYLDAQFKSDLGLPGFQKPRYSHE